MKKTLKLVFVTLLAAFVCGIVVSRDTYARPSTSSLATKAYVNAMGKCSNGVFFASPFSIYDLQGINSLTTNNSTATIGTPNGLSSSDIDASISCKTLFSKYIPNTSKIPSSADDRAAARNALVAIGYGSDGASGDTTTSCGQITYRDSSNAAQSSGELCFNTDNSGKLNSGELASRNDFPDTSKTVSLFYGNCPENVAVCLYYWDSDEGLYKQRSFGGALTSSATWADVESRINSAAQFLSNLTYQDPTSDGLNLQYRDVQYQSLPPETNTIPETYVYNTDNARNASKLVNYFGGYADWGAAAFTDQDKYWFYVDILDNFYGVSYDNSTCQVSKFDGAIIMKNQDDKLRWCKVGSANKNIGRSVNIFSAGDAHYLDATADLDGVIAALGNLDFFQISEYKTINEETGAVTDPGVDPNPLDDGDSSNATATEQCYGSPGTLGLSWLLCPILSGLSNTLNWVYSNIIEGYLEVDATLVSRDSVYETWQFFQNFANIIVVISLLVVIFSQLTGIGIDNYGIKKILPRLIVVAILINLSFFIVQFLVDVSNIVGNGIAGIFNTSSINIQPATYEGVSIPSHVLGLAVGAAGTVGVIAVLSNPAILLSFLGVLLSGLISVLVMWLVLTARKAGVVIAIVIAPVAFACYLLPNTSRLAKSWVNLVKGLLLVYPLAALLIGASFFASDLLADTANGNMVLPAMLLRVVPFFALPTLFKKSLDAFGNLGTRIQSIGQTLSRSATGAMRGADWYKNAQERGAERRTRLRAGLDQNGNEQTGWRALLRSGNARNRSRYRSQYLKNQADQNRADLLNDPEYMAEMRFKQDFALEGERDEIRLMNDPNYRESLRANQREALEKKQKDVQASMLKTGNFTYRDLAGNEQTITDPSSGKELQDALVAELSRSDGDISKINALYDAIRAKGDAGIDLLSNVWDSGTLDTSGRGFIEFRDKIVADGEIKSKARTFHSVAKDVQSGKLGYTGNQVTDARAAGNYVADIAAEKVPDLTSKELDALNVRAQGGDAVAQETIYRALANPDINSKIKGEDRNNVLLSGAHYFKNNFNQIDHTDDQVEIWTGLNPNTGKQETKEFGRTKEGIYFDASTGRDNKGNPLYGNPVNIGEYKGWGYQKTN